MPYTDIDRQRAAAKRSRDKSSKDETWVQNRRVRMRNYMRKRRAKDPVFKEKGNAQRRGSYRKLGIFEALLLFQDNKCALPGCTNPVTGKDGHLDHCHRTGNTRGILCASHNKGLGFFCDNPALLREAAKYIEKFTEHGLPAVQRR